MKKKKKRKRIIWLVIIIPIILTVFPIKFTKKANNNSEEEYYIASCISEGTTDAGVWIIIGNNEGMWEDEMPVIFNGKNPKNILSYDICNNDTEFIIYGKLSKKQDEEYYTLNSQRWEIYDEVRRGEYAYRIPFKHFITIYDLKWFDFLLTDKGYD